MGKCLHPFCVGLFLFAQVGCKDEGRRVGRRAVKRPQEDGRPLPLQAPAGENNVERVDFLSILEGPDSAFEGRRYKDEDEEPSSEVDPNLQKRNEKFSDLKMTYIRPEGRVGSTLNGAGTYYQENRRNEQLSLNLDNYERKNLYDTTSLVSDENKLKWGGIKSDTLNDLNNAGQIASSLLRSSGVIGGRDAAKMVDRVNSNIGDELEKRDYEQEDSEYINMLGVRCDPNKANARWDCFKRPETTTSTYAPFFFEKKKKQEQMIQNAIRKREKEIEAKVRRYNPFTDKPPVDVGILLDPNNANKSDADLLGEAFKESIPSHQLVREIEKIENTPLCDPKDLGCNFAASLSEKKAAQKRQGGFMAGRISGDFQNAVVKKDLAGSVSVGNEAEHVREEEVGENAIETKYVGEKRVAEKEVSENFRKRDETARTESRMDEHDFPKREGVIQTAPPFLDLDRIKVGGRESLSFESMNPKDTYTHAFRDIRSYAVEIKEPIYQVERSIDMFASPGRNSRSVSIPEVTPLSYIESLAQHPDEIGSFSGEKDRTKSVQLEAEEKNGQKNIQDENDSPLFQGNTTPEQTSPSSNTPPPEFKADFSVPENKHTKISQGNLREAKNKYKRAERLEIRKERNRIQPDNTYASELRKATANPTYQMNRHPTSQAPTRDERQHLKQLKFDKRKSFHLVREYEKELHQLNKKLKEQNLQK